MSSCGIFVIDNKIPSHLESNSSISSFRRLIVNKSALFSTESWLQWPWSMRRSSKQPATKETVLLLGHLFLQTYSSFEVRIMDDSVQWWSNPRIEYFKIWHSNSSDRWRRLQIIHWINHLHFFDPMHTFPREIANKYIPRSWALSSSEQKLLEWRSCQNWRSEICSRCWFLHNSLKNPPSLGRTGIPAVGPDWHLWSWTGVWLQHITCGDVCSDTQETRGYNSCGESLADGPSWHLKFQICSGLSLFSTVDEWSGSSIGEFHWPNSWG